MVGTHSALVSLDISAKNGVQLNLEQIVKSEKVATSAAFGMYNTAINIRASDKAYKVTHTSRPPTWQDLDFAQPTVFIQECF